MPRAAASSSELDNTIVVDIEHAMNSLLARVVALYQKTEKGYWYMRGPRARARLDLLESQCEEIYVMTDQMVERVRKIGGKALRSIGAFVGMRRVPDAYAGAYLDSSVVLAELSEDNSMLGARLRKVLKVCEWHRDIETASLIQVWIDKAERRKSSLEDAC